MRFLHDGRSILALVLAGLLGYAALAYPGRSPPSAAVADERSFVQLEPVYAQAPASGDALDQNLSAAALAVHEGAFNVVPLELAEHAAINSNLRGAIEKVAEQVDYANYGHTFCPNALVRPHGLDPGGAVNLADETTARRHQVIPINGTAAPERGGEPGFQPGLRARTASP